MVERRTRRRFTAECKAEAVQRLPEAGRGLPEVATELGGEPAAARRVPERGPRRVLGGGAGRQRARAAAAQARERAAGGRGRDPQAEVYRDALARVSVAGSPA